MQKKNQTTKQHMCWNDKKKKKIKKKSVAKVTFLVLLSGSNGQIGKKKSHSNSHLKIRMMKFFGFVKLCWHLVNSGLHGVGQVHSLDFR